LIADYNEIQEYGQVEPHKRRDCSPEQSAYQIPVFTE